MTESLTFSNPLIEKHDIIFYNFVGNFIPPEWRNLTNNCNKRLSTTSRRLLSLIVSRLQIYQKDRLSEELQEGYHFFEKELGVCQRRVRQCLKELQTSGFIDFTLITTIKYNLKCRNILCIKLLKKFINFRKANDNSYHFNHTNSQSSHRKILTQSEEKSNPNEKKFPPHNIIDNNISISLSRCEKNKKNCGQNLPEPESTKEQSFNLLSEVTVRTGEQSLSELKLTEEQSFNLPPKVTVNSVSEALPDNSTDCNSGDVASVDDESDSDSDSTGGGYSGNNGEQQPSRESASWISNIAKKAKNWYASKKLEEFHPLTKEDGALLRMRSGRDFNLSYINKLLIKLSEQYPDNRFPCKQAVLNYMKIALIREMRQSNLVNNDNFNFKIDDVTKAKEAYLLKIEANQDTSPRSQLKRKIAAAFEPDTAYKLLTSCRFVGVFNDEYKIDLADISLSDNDKSQLLNQVQAVYGKQVDLLDIISNKTTDSSNKSASVYSGLSQLDPKSVWYKIREYLLKSQGEFIDKAWFSQLEAIEEDMTSKKIILKPATAFIGAWIQNNYRRALEDACSSQNFTFEVINVDRMAVV
ncbi:DnaA N-terminal domain-containing protein [Candidatus Tisiphia endosymbiont of Metellina segmentata]|uniref:DnaA N-terminal domain-containing protein n=1 Tax=Candidatus Tisiphia endosymbiont of Metellina segmentata TaxID=3066274 RepID=UPI00313EF4FF